MCLLSAEGIAGTPAQMGKAADLKMGASVYTIGAPQGLELSVSNGIVSQLRGGPPPIIQTTAAISSGSSGGGLFNSDGLLVGLTTLYLKRGQNLNFAAPAEWIAEVKPAPKKEAPRPIRLFVHAEPEGARIRILNIKPRFHQGIELPPGKYHVEVSAEGYQTEKQRISLETGQEKRIALLDA